MKSKLSPQSKSFLILFIIAFIGAYACLIMAKFVNFPGALAAIERLQMQYAENENNNPMVPLSSKFAAASYMPTDSTTTVDTTDWKTYTDPNYNFTLKYPPQWQIKKPSQWNGYYVIDIDPGARYFDIKIYISPQGLFAMQNLPSKTITLAGQKTTDVEGCLYGLKYNGNYYTFDQGFSQSIKPDFEAMVKSLQFQ